MSQDNKRPNIEVSRIANLLQSVVPNPAAAAGIAGITLWGGSKLFYPQLKKAIKQLTTPPGQTPEPEIPDELKTPEQLEQEAKDERNIPIILGGLGIAGTLASQWSGAKGLPMGGLFSDWNDPKRYNPPKNPRRSLTSMFKGASANFSWDINDQSTLDFGKIIPVRYAQDMVMNDPYTEIYHKGNALDIINNASRDGQDNKISAGSLFDSALNKVQKNLTAQGVVNAALRGTIGYGIAKAFTNTVATVTDMPKGLQDAIVSAGMITNIIQGLY